jgi:hypothetical protein
MAASARAELSSVKQNARCFAAARVLLVALGRTEELVREGNRRGSPTARMNKVRPPKAMLDAECSAAGYSPVKSSVTIVNEAGDGEKQSLIVHLDDFWASTSKCEPHRHYSSTFSSTSSPF